MEIMGPKVSCTFFFLRFYLLMRDTDREAETQAEGEAGSMQGPQSCPGLKAGAQLLSHQGVPSIFLLFALLDHSSWSF